jgi:hypothetical protein
MARFVVPVAAPRPYAAGRHVFVWGRGVDPTRFNRLHRNLSEHQIEIHMIRVVASVLRHAPTSYLRR